MRIWNLKEKTEDSVLTGHTLSVNTVAITRDNKYIISGSGVYIETADATVRIWDFGNRRLEATLAGHNAAVLCVTITNDSRYIFSGSWDNTLRIWNFVPRNEGPVLRGHTLPITSIAITSDSKYIVSGSWDKTIRIWNIEEGIPKSMLNCSGWVNSLAITKDDKHVVCGYWSWEKDTSIEVWNLHDQVQENLVEECPIKIESLTITSDGNYVISACRDNYLKKWNISTKKLESAFPGHTSCVNALELTRDHKHLVSVSGLGGGFGKCTDEYSVRIWDVQKKTEETVLLGHTGGVRYIGIASDDKHIITGSEDRTFKVWDFQEKQIEYTLNGNDESANMIKISPDNKIAITCTSHMTITIWDLKERRERGEVKHQESLDDVAIAKNYRYIICSSKKNLNFRIWRISSK